MEAGARQIALEAVGYTRVRDADFYYQLVKWVSRLEAEASVDHAGMERANARELRAPSQLWHVRGEVQGAGVRQISLEAVRHARVRDAEFYYQLVKWVSRLEAKASVDHAGMERANVREQRALSHLWQVRGEEEDVGAGV